jgi:GT2 family glycosyltransferase
LTALSPNKNPLASTSSGRSTSSAPSVAAVVLNWNGREPVLRTIAALYKSDYPFEEILLVDNGSTDGSVEAVRAAFPAVVVLVQPCNLGPGQGRNVGIRRAVASGVDYIFNVDNDIEIFPDTVTILIEAAKGHPDVGVVGPMINFRSQPDVIHNVGGRVRFRQNLVEPIGWLEHDHGQFSQPLYVDVVGSAAMLTRREVFQQIGFFDADYIGYGLEDTDFCVKARRSGWTVMCDPRAKVRHDFQFNHKYTYRRKYLEARNAIIFLRKYGRWMDWGKYLIFAIGGLPYAFVREACHGNAGGVLGKARGLFDALMGSDGRAIEVFRSSK